MLTPLWVDFLNSLKKGEETMPVLLPILKQLKPVELTEKEITLACTNQGAKFLMEKKLSLLENLLAKHLKQNVSVKIVLQPKKGRKKEQVSPLLQFHSSLNTIYSRANLNPSFSFDNFAVSSTNQVAHSACQAVTDNPGKSYNPLFLYGGVGVGKTHLTQATARKILEKDNNKKVLFSPGDSFINGLIESIKSRTTPRFRRKYRFLNLLIIDDVQFIAGKEAVQEEFFHTFNSIISSGGQIILTSDKPPNKIKKLEDRLRSRFSGGLTIDIQPPDFELRTAILLIKAREKNIALDIEAAKILAEKITDTRSLEGSLLSIYAKILNTKEKIGVDEVNSFIQFKQGGVKKRLLPGDIIKTVCSYYNVPQARLKGKSRKTQFSLPRQVSMFLLREKLNLKLEEVAFSLKRKDHTTVIHGVEKIKRLLAKDPIFKKEVDQILRSLDLF